MLTGFRRGATAFLLVIMMPAVTVPPAAAQSGKQDYDTYCADCHGSDGKGNGQSAQVIPMNPPPPDLTQLGSRMAGNFPSMRSWR